MALDIHNVTREHTRDCERFPRKVTQGGSHVCEPNYCLGYRRAARRGEAVDTSTSHIGFRGIARE